MARTCDPLAEKSRAEMSCEPEPAGDVLDAELARRLNAWIDGEFADSESMQSSRPILVSALGWLALAGVAWIAVVLTLT